MNMKRMKEISPFSNDNMSDNELLYRIIYLKNVLAEEYNENNMKYYESIQRSCDDNKFRNLKQYREKQLEDTLFNIKARKHLCEQVSLLKNDRYVSWKKFLNVFKTNY